MSDSVENIPADMADNNAQPSIMSVKDWVITLIITALPIIGLIMLFVWAFGNNENVTKSNYAKGALIFTAILIVIYFIIVMMFAGIFMAALSGGNI